MTKNFLQYKDARVCYYRLGEGRQTIFCFHGYSNDALLFGILEKSLRENFTLIAIDLPFHGDTQWSRADLTPKTLTELIDLILHKEQLDNNYWLLGFSLGARVAMSLFQYQPDNAKKIILLSPDGLYTSVWYKFIVQTYLGNKLMAFLLNSPKKAMSVLNLCLQLRIINNRLYNFAAGFVHSKRESTLLYARWISMRRLHPQLKTFSQLVEAKQITVSLIFGKADKITPMQNAQYLTKFQNPFIHLEIWDAGHLLLKEKYLDQLVPLFK